DFTLPTIVWQNPEPEGTLLGGGVMVVHGTEEHDDGTTAWGLFSSTDGTTWTLRLNLGGKQLEDAIFANGIFVAVGRGGIIFTSPDGLAWTPRASNTPARLRSVAFGNGTWVVVGACGKILTSID